MSGRLEIAAAERDANHEFPEPKWQIYLVRRSHPARVAAGSVCDRLMLIFLPRISLLRRELHDYIYFIVLVPHKHTIQSIISYLKMNRKQRRVRLKMAYCVQCRVFCFNPRTGGGG